MSVYRETVLTEAKSLFGEVSSLFEDDGGEHGGKSGRPNLSKWIDGNRKLFERLDEVKKGWTRMDADLIIQSSRNSVPYGDPKESAYFAFYKDIMHEVKKLNKAK